MKTHAVLRKVPEVTVFFWIVKILTTAVGESTSDYLVYAINPYVAVAIGGGVFAIALALQFWVRRYYAWVYWFAVAMVAVFGTMAADVIHIALGVPYLYSTIFFAACLLIIFALWYLVEKTLSIHSISTPRRELFYWLTVATTFALGTAVGDMTAITLHLGYLSSGVLFAALIACVTLAHYVLKWYLGAQHRHLTRNAVFAFWSAYILTRPLGASFADWAGKAQSAGGLGWGDGTIALVLAALIIACVAYLAYSKIDVEEKHRLPETHA